MVYGVEMLIPALLNSLNPFLEKKSDLNLLKSIIRLISRCLFHLPQTSYNSSIESDVYMSQQGEAGFCCITENGLPREKRFSWPQQPACHSVRQKPLGCVFGYLPYFFFFQSSFVIFFLLPTCF